jgi:hypothetical protein
MHFNSLIIQFRLQLGVLAPLELLPPCWGQKVKTLTSGAG